MATVGPISQPDQPQTCAVGKRSGFVEKDYYSHGDFSEQLEPLVARLNSGSSGVKYDKRTLQALVAGLHQFQEDALGVNSMYKSYTRLPAQLLLDPSPDGPLAIIASACGEHMKAKALKRIDWSAPQSRKENLELLARIRAELLRGGYVRTPCVYVHPACGAAAPKLQEAVRGLKGEVAQSEGASGVTHVVHPFGDGGDPDKGERYARTLEVKGAQARVHWLYLPDSYDEWVPAAHAAAPPAARPLARQHALADRL